MADRKAIRISPTRGFRLHDRRRSFVGESIPKRPPSPRRPRGPSEEPTAFPRFPANFSLSFADWAVANAGQEDLIFDPFAGSASSLLAAASTTAESIGIELNPAWAVYGRARVIAWSDKLGRAVTELQKRIPESRARRLSFFRTLLQAQLVEEQPNEEETVVAAAVLATIRDSARLQFGSNYAWPVFERRGKTVGTTHALNEHVDAVLKHSKWVAGRGEIASKPLIRIGDALDTNAIPQGIDIVLTSPPYLSRLDYIRYSQPELDFLLHGSPGDDGVRALRKGQVGSVLVSGRKVQSSVLPLSSQRLLKRIEAHPSKGSCSYYAPFVGGYLTRIQRLAGVLFESSNPSAVAWIVIQDSYYKEFLIKTGSLLADIFEAEGWLIRDRWGYVTTNSLSAVSGAAKGWRASSPLTEWVYKFERSGEASVEN